MVISDKLLESIIAFNARNMEPIIISINCLDEVKELTIGPDTTNIDTSSISSTVHLIDRQ